MKGDIEVQGCLDRECNLSLHRKVDISVVIDSTFYVFNEKGTLFIYGESLNLWLSIGGLIKGNVQVVWRKHTPYYQGVISSGVFFKFIYDQGKIFDVSPVRFGYKIRVKANDAGDYIFN